MLPSGLPRTCCDQDKHNYTQEQLDLPQRLAEIVGKENVLDGRQLTTTTAPYLKGARLGGGGKALAIVKPQMLKQVVQCVQAIVDADCVVLPQGSNTGLTGGSVAQPLSVPPPSSSLQSGEEHHHQHEHRPVVVVSMQGLDTFFPMDQGRRMVCLAGAGLATLSRRVGQWFPDRESHSILGSTFLNPTTAAGVAFGSGGTQLRKGPA